MNYNILGNSNLDISEIAFGCMSLGDNAAENENLIAQALDKGINFFDTADLYKQGENEKQLGKALKDRRNDAIIATKVGNQWRADGSGWDWNPSPEYIRKAVEDSLRRLNVEYIDLYQLHGGTLEDPIDDIVDTFERLQHDGKIRYYGISSIRPNVIREWIQRSNMSSVMMQYSLLDRRPEEDMLPLLDKHNIGVLARGSVAKGLLAGKPAESYLNYSAEDVHKMANAVQQISADKRTPAQTAMCYILGEPAVRAAVVGIRTLTQLDEAAGLPLTTPLTSAERVMLGYELVANYYDQHR
ncbi:aldo/keto reductase [Chitinophaga pinensis]|uniref:Aldo/keto reductase n=1 Tax=Chitinophaga pinensis (strain ATCC 43595 / DSM 2588 / LMG 13176 / NBRC 15968 / NCIMB 11800 / UQM 2034) TaxID=485918 RepID=A0A979G1F6_CHIPD|nr:aldo/keto reductase [Chitinophaga pinensis]ACU58952.1 aldo/keto reductase [Chitinophaga pinensis DSM 2588]